MPVTTTIKGKSPLLSSPLLSSTNYVQVCSVCKGKFFRGVDWLKHLTLEDHQNLARKECLDKWDIYLRKCCLIIYTSDPLTSHNAGEIVDYFSRGIYGAGAMATDFVWWEDRPHIGILQFESRKKADNTLKTSGTQNSLKIKIGDNSQWIEVKNKTDLLELEWQGILPPKHHLTVSQQRTKRNCDHLLSQNQTGLTDRQDAHLTINENSLSPLPKRIRSCSDMSHSQQIQITGLPVAILEDPPPFPWTPTSHPLQFEYWTIRKSIHLPPNPPNQNKSQMEVQISRLLDYLCQFDPRSNSLTTLFTYWTALNDINLAGQANYENLLELPPHFTIKWLVIFFLCYKSYIPAPRQFLTKDSDKNNLIDKWTGKNIGFHCDPGCVDVWRTEKQNDSTSAIPEDEYSDEFLLSVLNLLREFLTFYNSCFGGSQEQVACTRDGKLINIKALLQPDVRADESRRNLIKRKELTASDFDALVDTLEREMLSEEFCGVYMTNPFLFNHKVSLAKNFKISLKQFNSGRNNIQSFLAKVDNVGVKGVSGKLRKALTIKKYLDGN